MQLARVAKVHHDIVVASFVHLDLDLHRVRRRARLTARGASLSRLHRRTQHPHLRLVAHVLGPHMHLQPRARVHGRIRNTRCQRLEVDALKLCHQLQPMQHFIEHHLRQPGRLARGAVDEDLRREGEHRVRAQRQTEPHRGVRAHRRSNRHQPPRLHCRNLPAHGGQRAVERRRVGSQPSAVPRPRRVAHKEGEARARLAARGDKLVRRHAGSDAAAQPLLKAAERDHHRLVATPRRELLRPPRPHERFAATPPPRRLLA
eukprot:7377015-Prymnesium_polylepis.2